MAGRTPTEEPYRPRSSAGQSAPLLRERSRVRVPAGSPIYEEKDMRVIWSILCEVADDKHRDCSIFIIYPENPERFRVQALYDF